MEPTAADLLLLQAVQEITDRDGRPPTFAEIATYIGWQASSRGNVQRQLDRLRPTHIEWDKSARSIRLTPVGHAALGLIESAANMGHQQPLPDTVLALLATGLTQLSLIMEAGRPLQAPYPHSWQRALNQLAAEFMVRGVDPIASINEAITLCKVPFKNWPVKVPSLHFYDEPLLHEDDQLSDLCREIAVARGINAEAEIVENLMLQVRTESQKRRSPASYSAVREFVIRQPVLSEEALMSASFRPEMEGLGGLLHDLYDSVPIETNEGSQVLLCGFCGWTLSRRKGRLVCGDDRCRLLTANFTLGTRSIDRSSSLLRVRPPIRRYVVAPGIYEVRVADRLRMLGLMVELWPSYDIYDLRIPFSTTEVWAVDLKDWRYPHFLSQKMTPLPSDGGYTWTRAFYVIPDERIRENPSYLAYLRNTTAHENFEVLTLSELIDAAKSRVEVPDA